MMRFVDLTDAYWACPDVHPNGPFAFLDTVTDHFVELDGCQTFFDVAEFDDYARTAIARDDGTNPYETAETVARLRGLIPERFFVVGSASKEADDAVQERGAAQGDEREGEQG